jgi:GT2 family glycosyltransferase
MPAVAHRISIVIVTRNRCDSLRCTLKRLTALPERPAIIVVDNGSSDGTLAMMRARFPEVQVITLNENHGAAGRNIGVRAAVSPYVAFSDDDSWWTPGALTRAVELFEQFPRMAVLMARVLVGADNRIDPVCERMAESPLQPRGPLPGPALLGFVACGAMVRRDAFLAVGGFDRHFGIGGEETLLSIDLEEAGYGLAYVDEIIAHHHPSPSRDPERRRIVEVRNWLWCLWLRRPLRVALTRTWRCAIQARKRPDVRRALFEALAEVRWLRRSRRVVPRWLELRLRQLER